MDIQFFDNKDVPQPPDKVKIERLDINPYPDGWRVKVNVDVTPFQERPNLEIRVRRIEAENAPMRSIAELSVIETMHRQMEFTIHIRNVQSPKGQYVAEVDLYYDDRSQPQNRREQPFTIE